MVVELDSAKCTAKRNFNGPCTKGRSSRHNQKVVTSKKDSHLTHKIHSARLGGPWNTA